MHLAEGGEKPPFWNMPRAFRSFYSKVCPQEKLFYKSLTDLGTNSHSHRPSCLTWGRWLRSIREAGTDSLKDWHLIGGLWNMSLCPTPCYQIDRVSVWWREYSWNVAGIRCYLKRSPQGNPKKTEAQTRTIEEILVSNTATMANSKYDLVPSQINVKSRKEVCLPWFLLSRISCLTFDQNYITYSKTKKINIVWRDGASNRTGFRCRDFGIIRTRIENNCD